MARMHPQNAVLSRSEPGSGSWPISVVCFGAPKRLRQSGIWVNRSRGSAGRPVNARRT